ncbi:hypothetical protein CLV93_1121 [Prolixibacter denitrificans]|uniref:Uncharacterized protein n=1 Tax=Prolixibacter denitrificans TaxID=1541063 RepID=A0A2P8C7D6_9BACT|nr:hypothetical protein CLV93_1121 [Prolixibacter denitrificans]
MNNAKPSRIDISLLFLIQLIGFLLYKTRLMIAPGEMTLGILNTISLWMVISFVPVTIPLIVNSKIYKIITLVFGIIITLVNIFLPFLSIIDNTTREPIIWAISMITICGISGITAIIKTIGWIKSSQNLV